jgi:hypothetical protein
MSFFEPFQNLAVKYRLLMIPFLLASAPSFSEELVRYYLTPELLIVISKDGNMEVTVTKYSQGGNKKDQTKIHRELSPTEFTNLKTAISKIDFSLNTQSSENIPFGFSRAGGVVLIRNPVTNKTEPLLSANSMVRLSSSATSTGTDFVWNPTEDSVDLLKLIENLARNTKGIDLNDVQTFSDLYALKNYSSLMPVGEKVYAIDYPQRLNWNDFRAEDSSVSFHRVSKDVIEFSFAKYKFAEGAAWQFYFASDPNREQPLYNLIETKVEKPGVLIYKFRERTSDPTQPRHEFQMKVDFLNYYAKLLDAHIPGIDTSKPWLLEISKMPQGFEGMTTVEAGLIPRKNEIHQTQEATRRRIHSSLQARLDFYRWWRANESKICSAPLCTGDEGLTYAEMGALHPAWGDAIGPRYLIVAYLASREGQKYVISNTGSRTILFPSNCDLILEHLTNLIPQYLLPE